MSLNSEIGSIAWAGLTGSFGATDCPGEIWRRKEGKSSVESSCTSTCLLQKITFFHLVFLS